MGFVSKWHLLSAFLWVLFTLRKETKEGQQYVVVRLPCQMGSILTNKIVMEECHLQYWPWWNPPLKSNNLHTIHYDGSLGRWDKPLVNQMSDVPSFFLGHSKLVYFHFCNFIKNKLKEFLQIILGTSDAWSIIHFSHRPSEPAS